MTRTENSNVHLLYARSRRCSFLGLLYCISFVSIQVSGDEIWRLLAGPEKEKGNPIEIVSNESGNLELALWKKRGHAALSFDPVPLPAVISFDWQSEYDPTVTEVATELWGTGDFRLSLVGLPDNQDIGELSEDNLGLWEGVQFRVFPHLAESPIRRYTEPNNESHTATSIWVRYTNPNRRTGDDGAPHTGLQSDACQNRNREDGIHNCGWDRRTIIGGGFGLESQQSTPVLIFISEGEIRLEVNGRRFAVQPEAMRFSRIAAIVVGITNTSRGYQTMSIRNLKATTGSTPKNGTPDVQYSIGNDGRPRNLLASVTSFNVATLQHSTDLRKWIDLQRWLDPKSKTLHFDIPEPLRDQGFFRIQYSGQGE